MGLNEILVWFTTVGAGALAYWLQDNILWFCTLSSWQKRIAAYAMAFVLAVLGWLASIAMGYTMTPEGWRAWVEGAVAVGTAAFSLGQLIHGARALSRTRN